MDKKSSPGKYILVFEPCYAYHQFAVSFTPMGEAVITKIKKYTDIPYDSSSKKIKKNLLGDIDKKLTVLSDIGAFFKEYVDPKIFHYCGGNLHKIFIGYKKNERMYTLACAFNNPELHSKLSFLDGSKISDSSSRQSFIDLILTNGDYSFLKFINQEYKDRNTNLSSVTLELANTFRNATDNMEGQYDCMELRALLEEKLSYYKEYREMFLLRQRYLDYLAEEKEKLQEARDRAVGQVATKGKTGKQLQDFEQISMFDNPISSDVPKTKKIGSL